MKRERENRIDLIRGISLLLIFVGHASFSFSEGLQHARGFADASELFVMMAGISAALAYYAGGRNLQLRATLRMPLLRARKIYLVHIGLLLALIGFLSLPVVQSFPAFDRASEALGLAGFWANPWANLVSVFLLQYMPGNFDILPVYVILIASVPLIFFLYDHVRLFLFALSIVIWLAAGFGHINLVNDALAEGHWYFDPLSWQLIFIIGIAIGIRIKTGQPVFAYHRLLFAAAVVFCLAAIPVNILFHFHFAEPPSDLLYRAMTSKTNDGILRLVNAVAIVYVLWNLEPVKRAADSRFFRPFLVIGRHSMPVFVAGLVLSDIMTVTMEIAPQTGLATQVLLMAAGILVQLAIGQWLERRRAKRAEPALSRGPVEKVETWQPAAASSFFATRTIG